MCRLMLQGRDWPDSARNRLRFTCDHLSVRNEPGVNRVGPGLRGKRQIKAHEEALVVENLIDLALPTIKSFVFAIVVLIVGLLAIRWAIKRVGEVIDKTELDATLKPSVKSVVDAVLKVLLAVAVISVLGTETTSFVALFGAVGPAVGLAFQGSLSNFAGGALILVTKPFKVGDFIEADGYSGKVEAVQVLYTDLVTTDNKVIRIPNGNLSNASITNYSVKDTRRVDFRFSASYDADSA